MKKIIPYESVRFISELDHESLLHELREHTDTSGNVYVFSKNHKYFSGTVADHEFKIRRIIHERNSFVPQIHGVIDEQDGKVTVRLKILPPIISTIVLLIILVAIVGDRIRELISNQAVFDWKDYLVVIAMPLIWSFVVISFWKEVNKAVPFLLKVLHGKKSDAT